ncbi:MAG: hypothetical protein QXY68_00960 [Saccharolobus sp.]
MSLAAYKLTILKVSDIVELAVIKKVKDEQIIDGVHDLESIVPDNSSDIVIIDSKGEKYINGKLNLEFHFSEPLHVMAISIPQQVNENQVVMQKIDLNVDNVIGGNLVKKDIQFIIFYTSNGTKIISLSDINPPTPERKQTKVKKKRRKSKKRAKKSNSRSKNKSKSSRKS